MSKVYITADEIQTPSCDYDSQETVISWNRGDDEIEIFTSDITTVTKLKNLMQKNPESYKCYYRTDSINSKTGTPFAYSFICDKSLISFRSQKSSCMKSEEEKASFVERMRQSKQTVS